MDRPSLSPPGLSTPGLHVPRVADAEVLHVQLAELLAVPCAAAIVHFQHQRAASNPRVNRVVARVGHDRPIDAGRPAVNHDQQRVRCSRREVLRLDQDAFDDRAIAALPRGDFTGPHLERVELRRHVGEPLLLVEAGRRGKHLDHRRGRAGSEAHARRIGGQRECAAGEVVGLADACDLPGGDVQPEQVRRRFLQGLKPEAPARPRNQRGLLVEGVGDRSHRAALGRYDRKPAVRMKEISCAAHRRLEGDLLAIGRPLRVGVGSGLRHDLLYFVAVQRQHGRGRWSCPGSGPG